jgi:hypothetical protein
MHGGHAGVRDLVRNPARRDEQLEIVPLYLQRGEGAFDLPADDFELQPGDQVLFAGRGSARDRQQALLRNEKVRDYVVTGHDPSTGWLWRRLRPRRSIPQRDARVP